MGCFTEIWIWMDVVLCMLMCVDTTAWNSISSSICFEIPQLEPMSKKLAYCLLNYLLTFEAMECGPDGDFYLMGRVFPHKLDQSSKTGACGECRILQLSESLAQHQSTSGVRLTDYRSIQLSLSPTLSLSAMSYTRHQAVRMVRHRSCHQRTQSLLRWRTVNRSLRCSVTDIHIKLGATGQRVNDKGIRKPNEEIMECIRSIKK